MSAYATPIIATLLIWWASTGVILYLDGLSRRTFGWSVAGATALLGIAFWGLMAMRDETTAASAYCAFCCGLTAWAWQLVSYYMGFITGPNQSPCPAQLQGWPRFVAAVRTSLHHEIAIILCALALTALTWDHPNRIGLWTYLVLWWMHTSAKLNLYFGAPNLGEELLPAHLRYLVTYMRRRPMNLFFPVSVTVSTVVTVLIAQQALAATTPFQIAGYAILATLMTLAVLEHWFLVAPLHANALWSWGVKEATAPGGVDHPDIKAMPVSVIEAPRAAG